MLNAVSGVHIHFSTVPLENRHTWAFTRSQVTTELRTLYEARHRNIVLYHQAFFDNGAVTIVMEYCDGGSLADVLRAMLKTRPGQAMPECFIAEIARQVGV